MPAQTLKAFHGNLPSFHATKLVAMATSLDRSSPNFEPQEIFNNGVNATIRVEIREPAVE